MSAPLSPSLTWLLLKRRNERIGPPTPSFSDEAFLLAGPLPAQSPPLLCPRREPAPSTSRVTLSVSRRRRRGRESSKDLVPPFLFPLPIPHQCRPPPPKSSLPPAVSAQLLARGNSPRHDIIKQFDLDSWQLGIPDGDIEKDDRADVSGRWVWDVLLAAFGGSCSRGHDGTVRNRGWKGGLGVVEGEVLRT